MPILTPPTGEAFSPYRQSRLPELMSGIARILGERAKKRREVTRERKLLKTLGIEMPGEEVRPEPTTLLEGVGRGLEGVLAAPEEPVTGLRKALIEAGVEARYKPRKWEPRTEEEALEFERAKAGLKSPASKVVGKKLYIYNPNKKTWEKAPGMKKVFDPAVTNKVLSKFTDPALSDEEILDNIKELTKNRDDYEDAGVDVSNVIRRAILKEKQTGKTLWQRFLKGTGEFFR